VPSLALLYDVHGNLPALEAVLTDLRDTDLEGFLLGGDYALFGAWPQETVERLRALEGATWIRGNGERWTATPGDAPDDDVVQGAIEACRSTLGADTVRQLAGLPQRVTIDGTLYCHASPISDVHSFMPEPADDDDQLLAGVSESCSVTPTWRSRVRPRTACCWSTLAASGCRSTATLAPHMPSYATTARSSTGARHTTIRRAPGPCASGSVAGRGRRPSRAGSRLRDVDPKR
jgi:hypothetical protein